MNKEKLKLVLDLYRDGKINFEQAVLLLDEPKANPLNLGGIVHRSGEVFV